MLHKPDHSLEQRQRLQSPSSQSTFFLRSGWKSILTFYRLFPSPPQDSDQPLKNVSYHLTNLTQQRSKQQDKIQTSLESSHRHIQTIENKNPSQIQSMTERRPGKCRHGLKRDPGCTQLLLCSHFAQSLIWGSGYVRSGERRPKINY